MGYLHDLIDIIQETNHTEHMYTLQTRLQSIGCIPIKSPNHVTQKQSKGDLAIYNPSVGLLSLLVELHQEIILHLTCAAEPDVFDLRNTNGYFRSIIRPADLWINAMTRLQFEKSKAAELVFQSLKVENSLPCTLCLSLFPIERFHHNFRHGKWILGGKKGHQRFCMDCEIGHGKFHNGEEIKVDSHPDNYRKMCSACHGFFDAPERIPSCPAHFR